MRGIIPVGLHRAGVRSYQEGRQVETDGRTERFSPADMLNRPTPASIPSRSLMEERPSFKDYWAARTTGPPPAMSTASMMSPGADNIWFTPAQKLWGAGLVTGIGGIVDAAGKYPVPPGDDTTILEMLRSERMPSMVEHYKTGHPVIGTLQGLGLLPLVGYAKAASGPVRTALGVEKVAAKTPAPTGIAAIPMTRRKLRVVAGAGTTGIAALGTGIGRVTKGANTMAAASAGRVGAKVGQMTRRADIRGFHDWVVNKLVNPLIAKQVQKGLQQADNPLSVTSRGRVITRRVELFTGDGEKVKYPDDDIGSSSWSQENFGERMGPWLDHYGLDADDFNVLDMSYQEKGGVGTVGRDLLRTDALTGGKPKETKLRFDKEEALDYAEEIKNDPDSFLSLDEDELKRLNESGELPEWAEPITVFGESGGAEIKLYEHLGVPVIKDEFGSVFVPNEVGLQKLELHQMKQVMGDDFPEIMGTYPVHPRLQMARFRDKPVGPFYGPGHHLAEISDRSPVWPVVENYLDIPLAK